MTNCTAEALSNLATEICGAYGEEPLADNDRYFEAFGEAFHALRKFGATPAAAYQATLDTLGDCPTEDGDDDADAASLHQLAWEICDAYGEEPLTNDGFYFAAFGEAFCALLAHGADADAATEICDSLLGETAPSENDD